MDRIEIEAKVKDMISNELSIKVTNINNTDNLMRDLNADSLDLIVLMMDLEEEFRYQVPEEDLDKIHTVQDIIDYIADKKDCSGAV